MLWCMPVGVHFVYCILLLLLHLASIGCILLQLKWIVCGILIDVCYARSELSSSAFKNTNLQCAVFISKWNLGFKMFFPFDMYFAKSLYLYKFNFCKYFTTFLLFSASDWEIFAVQLSNALWGLRGSKKWDWKKIKCEEVEWYCNKLLKFLGAKAALWWAIVGLRNI